MYVLNELVTLRMPKKLRNMCKVVDSNTQGEAAQQQAMEEYAKNGNRTASQLPKRITAEELAKLPTEQVMLDLPGSP